jgi:hypothetical protein
MNGLPTGRYDILRGSSSTNEYGDEIEAQTVHRSGVLGSVIERRRTVFNPSDSRVATVRELTGRFKHGEDIIDGDRIKDVKTGEIFVVSAVYRGTSLAGKADLVLDLSFS